MTVEPQASPCADAAARLLLEIEAVLFNARKPFILTSGRASPVYVDCRKIISFPRARNAVIDMAVETLYRDAGYEVFDAVAGGETAGIPFAAWIADRLSLPMQYIRKKPKGFGRDAQIEGWLKDGDRVLLVEDLATDSGSKVNFINAIRNAGGRIEHAFVVFHYGIFPQSLQTLADLGVRLHALATWWDVLRVARSSAYFDSETLDAVEAFLTDPAGWSRAHGGQES